MAEPSLALLAAAGLVFEPSDRALHVPCTNAPVELLLVRPRDIPEYVQDGVVDCGITGANLIVETSADAKTLLELGFGHCTLEAAVPAESAPTCLEDLTGLRVATAYPVTTKQALENLGVVVTLVTLSGSVEVAPRLGLADAIVDLVATGTTAEANGLRRIGTLLSSQAVLIGASSPRGNQEMLARLEMMLSGVIKARGRRYLMLNAPAERIAELEALLPGMGAPSVMELAAEGQMALHAVVLASDVWDLIPRLKAAGASSILVLDLERVIP